MKKISGIIALVAFVAMTSFGAITFDPVTGTGFVGKGDVQLALGWNNAQLQSNSVWFTYVVEDIYEVEAEWYTGPDHNVTRHTISVPRTVSVNASVVSESRKNSQDAITGFNLAGFGSYSSGGSVPVVGGNFNDGNDVKTIISVTLVSSSGGGLFVNGVAL